MSAATPGPRFSRRVAGVFGTRVVAFAANFGVAFLLARLLGPDGTGTYNLILLLPTTMFALGQLGLPSAVTFFTGRGHAVASLLRSVLILTVVVSAILMGLAVAFRGPLEQSIVAGAPEDLLLLALLYLPIQFASTLGGSILYGRQAVREYNLILIAESLGLLAAVVLLVGLLHQGLAGAVVAYLFVNAVAAVAILLEVGRLERRLAEPDAAPIGLGSLLGYGLRLYPASTTSFFNYRADVFILEGVTHDNAAVGWYGMAVRIAEALFYVPDAVSTIFYPTVAGSEKLDADRMTPGVTRLTILITAISAVVLIPVAFVALSLLVPAFLPSMVPLVVLLPGIVMLSISKVLAGYISGIGRPLPVTLAATTAMVINIAVNLVLIPRFGMTGAAAASLVSYSVHAAIMLTFAVRLSGSPLAAFVLPRRSDGQRLWQAGVRAAGRLRRGLA